MIIDFHCHVFPDDLAKRAISTMTAGMRNPHKPVNDGTVSGLLANMDAWGIDISVVQPVATRASQPRKINEWVRSIISERIIGFGGIWPHSDDYKSEIDLVASLGLRGIKLHPEYQGFVVDEPRMLRIYDYALGKGLILLFHAGADRAFKKPYRSSPRQFAAIIRAMAGGTIVAAHLGGNRQWDDVERYLVGENIYLDTSMGFEYYTHEQFLRIAKKHDKLLFASDAPWSSAGTELEHIRSLPLSDSEKNAILGGNAARLLKIERR